MLLYDVTPPSQNKPPQLESLKEEAVKVPVAAGETVGSLVSRSDEAYYVIAVAFVLLFVVLFLFFIKIFITSPMC